MQIEGLPGAGRGGKPFGGGRSVNSVFEYGGNQYDVIIQSSKPLTQAQRGYAQRIIEDVCSRGAKDLGGEFSSLKISEEGVAVMKRKYSISHAKTEKTSNPEIGDKVWGFGEDTKVSAIVERSLPRSVGKLEPPPGQKTKSPL